MATTKADWLKEAKELGIKVESTAKIAEIKALLEDQATKENKIAADVIPGEAEDLSKHEEDSSQQAHEDKPLAKAGKRSAKALTEAEEAEAKEARKTSGEAAEKPKKLVRPSRPRLERRGKLFRKSAEKIEKGTLYSLEQAVALAKETSHVKFDATVELHVNLDVDPKVADQNIRDSLLLPAGTGKAVRIAVLTDDAAGAKKAGADIAGNDDFLAELEKGAMDFDILIATPALMAKLGKYARVLGPRGLMPNPKSGTVTTDVNRAVAEAKAGRVEYRVDSTGIIHLGVGKVSFTAAQLLENVQAVLSSVKASKPSSIKGNYVKTIHLTTSMGPSVAVDLASVV